MFDQIIREIMVTFLEVYKCYVVFYEKLAYNVYSRKVGVYVMPNIKPVSDLRNYTEVLKNITVGEPVFLTKNGRGRYAIVDIEEYERTKTILKLIGEIFKGEKSTQENGWTDIDKVEKLLGANND